MDEFKRIPFGGNPYADFEFFKLELKVSEIKYTPEQIYAHFVIISANRYHFYHSNSTISITQSVPKLSVNQYHS